MASDEPPTSEAPSRTARFTTRLSSAGQALRKFSFERRRSRSQAPRPGEAPPPSADGSSSDDAPLATGWLVKPPSSRHGAGPKFWKRRWCMLVGTQLRYFESCEVDEASGSVRGVGLRGTVLVTGCRPRVERPRTLELRARPKSLLVQAEDEEAFALWLAALHAGLRAREAHAAPEPAAGPGDGGAPAAGEASEGAAAAAELSAASAHLGPSQPRRVTLEDLEIVRVLGKGSFATVALVLLRQTGEHFALKSLNKRHLMMSRQVEATRTEREILRTTRHPFLVRLHWAFQSEQCLHFMLTYMPGGDLYDRLEEEGALPLERARLYMAELCLALSHLHDELQVIYRDVKPDNVLIDVKGHACLADFGLAKLAEGKAQTVCGTPSYMAPEVIKSLPHDKAADWWGFGCLLCELIAGETPFAHDNPLMVQRNILKKAIELPASLPPEAAALVERMLDRDAAARLGSGPTGTAAVQAHPFWQPLNFEQVLQRGYQPLWLPPDEAADPSAEPDESSAALPVDDSDESDDGQPNGRGSIFRGFSYRRESMAGPRDSAASDH